MSDETKTPDAWEAAKALGYHHRELADFSGQYATEVIEEAFNRLLASPEALEKLGLINIEDARKMLDITKVDNDELLNLEARLATAERLNELNGKIIDEYQSNLIPNFRERAEKAEAKLIQERNDNLKAVNAAMETVGQYKAELKQAREMREGLLEAFQATCFAMNTGLGLSDDLIESYNKVIAEAEEQRQKEQQK